MKGGQLWWNLMRRFTVPEFQTYMDGLVEIASEAHEVMPWFAADGGAGDSATRRRRAKLIRGFHRTSLS